MIICRWRAPSHTLTVELTPRERFATPEEVKRELFAYLKGYYNRQRFHSALGYIDDESKGRAILTQLNRREARYRLIRVVCHGIRGEIGKPHRQGQEEQLGILGLALDAIVLWNAINIGAVVERIRAEGTCQEFRVRAMGRASGVQASWKRSSNRIASWALACPIPLAAFSTPARRGSRPGRGA
jgi:hypothetical protein